MRWTGKRRSLGASALLTDMAVIVFGGSETFKVNRRSTRDDIVNGDASSCFNYPRQWEPDVAVPSVRVRPDRP